LGVTRKLENICVKGHSLIFLGFIKVTMSLEVK
jgi:hypothetical protein